MKARLVLEDGTEYPGIAFGSEHSSAGEVVFTTGMVGYPESLTDPSYIGQILILTYPIVGSYGVPESAYWESSSLKISGLVVSNYIDTPSHIHSNITLSQWLKKEGVPGIEIKDTRFLAQKLRDEGAKLGKIIIDKDIPYYNPNVVNLVSHCSPKKITREGKGRKKVLLIDCGSKRNLTRDLLERKVEVITVPWDFDPFASEIKFDAIIISNGPGDPKQVVKTIETVKKSLKLKIPTFGVCLGHQILSLAAGGDTYKLKFGHRGQNQPCILTGTNKCYLTTQNHGFAVGKLPPGFRTWFTNANDNTNEGIIHQSSPFMSVQFHPEVTPGPMDTDWLFDYFLKRI